MKGLAELHLFLNHQCLKRFNAFQDWKLEKGSTKEFNGFLKMAKKLISFNTFKRLYELSTSSSTNGVGCCDGILRVKFTHTVNWESGFNPPNQIEIFMVGSADSDRNTDSDSLFEQSMRLADNQIWFIRCFRCTRMPWECLINLIILRFLIKKHAWRSYGDCWWRLSASHWPPYSLDPIQSAWIWDRTAYAVWNCHGVRL